MNPFAFQRELFPETIKPIIDPDLDPEMSVEERFWAFHKQNPHVYEMLKQLALRAQGRGMERWSTRAMFEVLRFMSLEVSQGREQYKLNNSFTPFYTDLLLERVPGLAADEATGRKSFLERRRGK